jgi:hypothetical protein
MLSFHVKTKLMDVNVLSLFKILQTFIERLACSMIQSRFPLHRRTYRHTLGLCKHSLSNTDLCSDVASLGGVRKDMRDKVEFERDA